MDNDSIFSSIHEDFFSFISHDLLGIEENSVPTFLRGLAPLGAS